MKPDKLEQLAQWYVLAAGALDFSTGLGLVWAPPPVLALMRVTEPETEALIYLRWVGAFVAAVGFVYLWAYYRAERALLRAMLELTIWFRLAAGGFAAWAIATGHLPRGWLSVPLTDAALAVVQIWLLRRGVFR
ncbi:MAG TPA: hypothetical protein VFJ90_13820 [Candidatus Didemnitutus sp.]|nr:hypothetical protein [Candidatus Didemnitutus sp.]